LASIPPLGRCLAPIIDRNKQLVAAAMGPRATNLRPNRQQLAQVGKSARWAADRAARLLQLRAAICDPSLKLRNCLISLAGLRRLRQRNQQRTIGFNSHADATSARRAAHGERFARGHAASLCCGAAGS
jgi:hypothetical protein